MNRLPELQTHCVHELIDQGGHPPGALMYRLKALGDPIRGCRWQGISDLAPKELGMARDSRQWPGWSALGYGRL